MANYNFGDVLNHIIFLSRKEGFYLNRTKALKLLYFCQGYYLAATDNSLFQEELEKWQHGPVCREAFIKLKYEDEIYKSSIPDLKISTQDKKFINDVCKVFAKKTAGQLSDLSHQQAPWKDAEEDAIIPKEKIKDFFKTQIKSFTEEIEEIEDIQFINSNTEKKTFTDAEEFINELYS